MASAIGRTIMTNVNAARFAVAASVIWKNAATYQSSICAPMRIAANRSCMAQAMLVRIHNRRLDE